MKKFVPILITALIVGAAAFYGGMLYQGKDFQANALQGNSSSGQRQMGRGTGGMGRNGSQAGNFINGEIISSDDKSVTLKLRDGGSKIVFFSSSTNIMKSTQASASDFSAGKNLMVSGTANADGSISAQSIQIRPALDTLNTGAQGQGGMSMQPQTPAPLTDEQSAQLKAGEAAHEPTTLTFNVTGGSFYFTPNVIHVKKGDKVKIVYNNAGGMHDFVLDEFNVKIPRIKTGETSTAEFVADKTGTFEYYCSVGSHRQMGQKGTLIVE